jgi:hypothetical protein
MAIEAPLSRHKRTNSIIYILACVAAAAWFGYDGYLNKDFIAEHMGERGHADYILVINQKAPPVLLVGAALFGVCLWRVRGRKVVAEDNELVVAGRERIPYETIDRIDKTYFEKKGFFTIVYKKDGREVERKLSDRDYDNLGPILDHLIAKIT